MAALSRVSVAGRLVPATRLVRTTDDHAALLARLGFAMVMLPHGAQKAFGWFRDDGFQATINAMTDHGWPGGRSGVRRLAELLGSLGLFVGLLGRVAAASIAGVMLGAISFVPLQIGFVMN